MALTTNLVSYWNFDGNLNDSVGSNNLTDSGTSDSGLGRCYKSRDVTNATNDKATFSWTPTSAFTINLWYYQTGSGNYYTLMGWKGSGTHFFHIRRTNTTNVELHVVGAATVQIPVAQSLNAWAMYTLTYSSGTWEFFKNGVSVNTGSASITATAGPMGIGRAIDTNNEALGGRADEMGLWSRVLSGAEITELYNSGMGLPYPFTLAAGAYNYYKMDETAGTTATDSVGNVNGTYTNVTLGASGKIGTAVTFNNSTAKCDIGDFAVPEAGGTLTLTAWGLLANTGNFVNTLLRNDINAWPNVVVWRTAGNTALQFGVAGTTQNVPFTADTNWHFFVAVFDGAYIRQYIDGVEVGTPVAKTGLVGASANTAVIGMGNGTTEYWRGTIDEFGIWTRALSATEVSSLYNSGTGLTYPFTTVTTVTNDANFTGGGI